MSESTSEQLPLPSTVPVAPSDEFSRNSVANPDWYARARENRLDFWAEQARDYISWSKPFTEVLDWSNAPFARWFADGELNVAYNCLDRHLEAGHGDRTAIIFEGEPGDSRHISYAELSAEVNKLAN